MKIVRVTLIVLACYVGLGLLLDSAIGFFQPGTDVLRSYDEDGAHDTVLSVLEEGDQLWVHSGHHFRGWYYRIQKNPDVLLIRSGVSTSYRAVALQSDEDQAYLVGLMKRRAGAGGYWFGRFMLLFAEVKPVRLDPR